MSIMPYVRHIVDAKIHFFFQTTKFMTVYFLTPPFNESPTIILHIGFRQKILSSALFPTVQSRNFSSAVQ